MTSPAAQAPVEASRYRTLPAAWGGLMIALTLGAIFLALNQVLNLGFFVGKTMLDALVVRARKIGAESLILEVAVDNDVAIAMYRSRGFAQIGLRKRYYQPEDVDAFTMQLVLDPVVVPPHEDDLLDDVAEPTAASGDSV